MDTRTWFECLQVRSFFQNVHQENFVKVSNLSDYDINFIQTVSRYSFWWNDNFVSLHCITLHLYQIIQSNKGGTHIHISNNIWFMVQKVIVDFLQTIYSEMMKYWTISFTVIGSNISVVQLFKINDIKRTWERVSNYTVFLQCLGMRVWPEPD